MTDTAAQYVTEAKTCLATAEHNNVGTTQAAYWLARAQVYATLAVAAATIVQAGEVEGDQRSPRRRPSPCP